MQLKIPFNNKNLKKFADNLYHQDKNGNEHYMPLCRGTLARANGEITHCALGELYEHFTGKPVARRATEKDVKDGTAYYKTVHHVDEEQVAGALADNATFSKKYKQSKNNKLGINTLYWVLSDDVPAANDRTPNKSTEDVFIQRAKDVQKELYRIANKYLE